MGQDHQFGIGRQDVAHRVQKAFSRLDAGTHLLDIGLGDVHDTTLAVGHEGQRVVGMAFSVGAMAGGLSAGDGGQRQGPGEGVLGDGVAAELVEFALPPACGIGTGDAFHLNVILR